MTLNHPFNCSQLPTQHNTTGLWKKPLKGAEVIQKWESRLAFLRDKGIATQRYPWRRGSINHQDIDWSNHSNSAKESTWLVEQLISVLTC